MENLIKQIRRDIINIVASEIEDKKERTTTLVELCLRFKDLSEGKSPSFPELTPMIKRVNRITTFVNSKIGHIQGIEREKFFKELSRSIFAFLGALSVRKTKTAYNDLYNIIGIFTKLATAKEWAALSKKIDEDPEFAKKYFAKRIEYNDRYVDRQIEKDPKAYLQRLRDNDIKEAERLREDKRRGDIYGFLLILREQLASKKKAINGLTQPEEVKKELLNEFAKNLEIINDFRHKANEYLKLLSTPQPIILYEVLFALDKSKVAASKYPNILKTLEMLHDKFIERGELRHKELLEKIEKERAEKEKLKKKTPKEVEKFLSSALMINIITKIAFYNDIINNIH